MLQTYEQKIPTAFELMKTFYWHKHGSWNRLLTCWILRIIFKGCDSLLSVSFRYESPPITTIFTCINRWHSGAGKDFRFTVTFMFFNLIFLWPLFLPVFRNHPFSRYIKWSGKLTMLIRWRKYLHVCIRRLEMFVSGNKNVCIGG